MSFTVPGGGPGSQFRNVNTTIDFVRATYPKVKYLVTTCTGAGIAARAGRLGGRRATRNKKAWGFIVAMDLKVKWGESREVGCPRECVDELGGDFWARSSSSLLWMRCMVRTLQPKRKEPLSMNGIRVGVMILSQKSMGFNLCGYKEDGNPMFGK
jgi:hypothetical protein